MAPFARGGAARRGGGHRGLRGRGRHRRVPGRLARRAAVRRHAPLSPAGGNAVGARAALLRAGDDAGVGLQSRPRRRARLPRPPARIRAAPRATGGSPGRRVPSINADMDAAAARAVADALQRAKANAASAPPRYRALIAALAARHPDPSAPVDEDGVRGEDARAGAAISRTTPRSRRSPPRRSSTCIRTTGGRPTAPPKPWTGDATALLRARVARRRPITRARTTTGST